MGGIHVVLTLQLTLIDTILTLQVQVCWHYVNTCLQVISI